MGIPEERGMFRGSVGMFRGRVDMLGVSITEEVGTHPH